MRQSNQKIKLAIPGCLLLVVGIYFVKKQFGVESNIPNTEISTLKSYQQTPVVQNVAPIEVNLNNRFEIKKTERNVANQGVYKAKHSFLIPESITEKFKFSSVNIDLNQEGWKTVSNVIAVPISADSKEDPNALLRVNHHNLYLIGDDTHESKDEQIAINPDVKTVSKQVVFNVNGRRVAIVSGTVIIELLNKDNYNDVVKDHALNVAQFLEHLNTIFVNTTSQANLIKLKNELTLDKRVKKFEVEFLEDILVKQ